jgi:hypothetical protein
VAYELEFTSGALVNAQDELVCARIEIEKKRDNKSGKSRIEREQALENEHIARARDS